MILALTLRGCGRQGKDVEGIDVYSAAFSGSADAAGAAESPASLDSFVAAPLSPPLGSASDEVQSV